MKGLSASALSIRLGILKQSDTGGEKFSTRRITSHPDYNGASSSSDYALVELAGESKQTPVMLNAMEIIFAASEADSLNVTTAGWGTTSEGGNVSTVLRKVSVPLVSRDRCNSAYPNSITDTMLCAGLDTGGKDSCQGDSGGPLVVPMGPGNHLLVGVVSWGEGCARPRKFGVYAKVSAGIEWIESQLDDAL